jgi:hypothetical protein
MSKKPCITHVFLRGHCSHYDWESWRAMQGFLVRVYIRYLRKKYHFPGFSNLDWMADLYYSSLSNRHSRTLLQHLWQTLLQQINKLFENSCALSGLDPQMNCDHCGRLSRQPSVGVNAEMNRCEVKSAISSTWHHRSFNERRDFRPSSPTLLPGNHIWHTLEDVSHFTRSWRVNFSSIDWGRKRRSSRL